MGEVRRWWMARKAVSLERYDEVEKGSWVVDEAVSSGKVRKRQGRLEVLELRADGSKAMLAMRMREVMRRVAEAIDEDVVEESPPKPSLSAPSLLVSSVTGGGSPRRNKSFTAVTRRESSARQQAHGSIHARDLRSMDPAYTLKAAHPGIVVRRHVILANFDPLRAVIVHDRMLVLLPKHLDDGLVDDLCQQLRIASMPAAVDSDDGVHPSTSSRDDDDEDAPTFELRALEAVLAVATRRLTADCDQRLSPRTTQLIELLRTSRMSLEHLERLRRLKNEVSYQEARARDTVEAIEAVLDSDEDMCMMRLAALRATPHLFEPPLSPHLLTQHEDVEDLLENYLQHATATQTRLELLRLGIENAVDLFNMKLDIARNRLITADTIFNLVAMCLAFCAVIGGFYGMNLDLQGPAFRFVTLCTVAICVLVGLFVFALLYRANILLF